MKNLFIRSVDVGCSQLELTTPISTQFSCSKNINSTGTSFADMEESVIALGEGIICVMMKQDKKQQINKNGGRS